MGEIGFHSSQTHFENEINNTNTRTDYNGRMLRIDSGMQY